HTGDVAAWMRETLHEPRGDRISGDRNDDRNRCCRRLGRSRPRRAMGENRVDLQMHQLGCESRKTRVIALSPSVLYDKVFAFNVFALAQSLSKRLDKSSMRGRRRCAEKTKTVHLCCLLLSLRGSSRGENCESARQDGPALHQSIT